MTQYHAMLGREEAISSGPTMPSDHEPMGLSIASSKGHNVPPASGSSGQGQGNPHPSEAAVAPLELH